MEKEEKEESFQVGDLVTVSQKLMNAKRHDQVFMNTYNFIREGIAAGKKDIHILLGIVIETNKINGYLDFYSVMVVHSFENQLTSKSVNYTFDFLETELRKV